jgi:hypothetical protein
MSKCTAEIKSSHLTTWSPNFLKICSTYKSDKNAMNIDIALFVAWLALQQWRIGRIVFWEIQHFNISLSPSLLIAYTRISTYISELKVREASSQTLYMERLNSNTKNFFCSAQILRELLRITTIAIPQSTYQIHEGLNSHVNINKKYKELGNFYVF